MKPQTTMWKSRTLGAYQRRTLAADALIAGCYLSGTNTRRVRRALATLFRGAVGKDTVSRVWRKVKSDWEASEVFSYAFQRRHSALRIANGSLRSDGIFHVLGTVLAQAITSNSSSIGRVATTRV